jgi:hypothetical protein
VRSDGLQQLPVPERTALTLRGRVGDIVLLLAVTVLALGAAEGAYRLYLSRQLTAQYNAKVKGDPSPGFVFYGYPPPWHFDRELGFSYTDGSILGGAIDHDAFAGCNPRAVQGNKYGNASELRSDYASADVKILLLGSSFTMGDPDWRGDTPTNQLEVLLSQRLGKRVSILNYSRDSTGILTMLDIARTRIDIDKPDLLLFTFNSTAFAYQRHWRIVKESRPGFFRMYQSLDPTERADENRRAVVPIPISSEVTPQWCEGMRAAMAAGDREKLRTDPLVRDLVDERNAMLRERDVPVHGIDFTTTSASFIYNRIVHGYVFHDMKLFEDKAIFGPLTLSSFAEDPQFIEAMAFVRASGIPFRLIHLPMLGEMESGKQYDFWDPRGALLLESFETAAGQKTIDLSSYYSAPLRASPRAYIVSEQDWHPNDVGIREMAEAFARLLLDGVLLAQSPLPGH